MKKMALSVVMLFVTLMAFAGSAVASPVTIPIKLENPQFGNPCEVPLDLGFTPILSFSETNTITKPSGDVVGSTEGCQFLKETWSEGGMDHQLYVSFFTFMLPDGDLDLQFTNHLKTTVGTMTFEISGSIIDGTGSYADASGHVWGGGVWPKNASGPNVHLVLQLR